MVPEESDGLARTLCTLCTEDFNPVIEDLQSISICGHVFHEFCLQQHLASAPTVNNHRCPVCRQKFSQENVNRLYFRMIGEQEKSYPFDASEDAIVGCRKELVKLGKQLKLLNQVLEQRDQHMKKLREELYVAKDLAKNEEALKLESQRENETLQQMLFKRTEELARLNVECSKLREKRSELRKELAAHKAGSTLDLDEEEITRLASDGHIMSNEDVIDTLRKALVYRNGSYKELMSQCDLLGREGKRSQKKLAKAEKKMEKLKGRLKEMETALQDKDNQISKILKLRGSKRALEGGANDNFMSKGKKRRTYASPQSCCTEKSVDRSSDDHAKDSLAKVQQTNIVKASESERVYVGTDEGAALQIETDIQSHSQVRVQRRSASGNGVQLQYSKEPEQLASNEQIGSHVGMVQNDREPILTEPVYVMGRDDQKHNSDSHVDVHGALITLDNGLVQIAKDNQKDLDVSTASPEHVHSGPLGSELASSSVAKGCRQGQTEPRMPSSLENLGPEGKWGQNQSLIVKEPSSSEHSKKLRKLSESNAIPLGPRYRNDTTTNNIAHEQEERLSDRRGKENVPLSSGKATTSCRAKTPHTYDPSFQPSSYRDHSHARDSRGLLGRHPPVVQHWYHHGSRVPVFSLPRQQCGSNPRQARTSLTMGIYTGHPSISTLHARLANMWPRRVIVGGIGGQNKGDTTANLKWL